MSVNPHESQSGDTVCVSCGTPADFHRAVVDTQNGDVIGSLCESCEVSAFGTEIGDQDDVIEGTCQYCSRDAYHALVDWVPEEKRAGDIIEVTVTTAPDRGALELCDGHFFGELLEDAASHMYWNRGEASD